MSSKVGTLFSSSMRNAVSTIGRTAVGRPAALPAAQQLRLKSATAMQLDTEFTAVEKEQPVATTASSAGRWTYTVEIMFSKLFPGGFGWQYSSGIAADMGFADDTLAFAATTGAGDATGVIIGHSVYKIGQSLVKKDVSVRDEIGTAVWLGGGAFFAGGAWQPIVNFLHGSCDMPFTPTFVGTFVGCGTMFFLGLRAGRAIMPWMPSSGGVSQDIGLSVSIGGATGLFVATDPSFIGAGSDALYEVAAPVFNITDADSALLGCVKAGGSTFTGFGLTNGLQNAVLPAGQNWADGNNPYC